MKFHRRSAIFASLLILLVIGILELTLGLMAFVSPKIDRLVKSSQVPPHFFDSRIQYRPNPAYPGHDRKGFRNLDVPARADIVVLGDSHTYGSGVNPEDAWPRQAESLMGKTIYNMAYNGYGPVHSLALWDEAVTLSPTVVIEALYFGNDLYDSFNFVYNMGQLTTLKSFSAQVQKKVQAAEQSNPIARRVSLMFNMGQESVASNNNTTRTMHFWFALRDVLAQHSRLYGLFERSFDRLQRMTRPTTHLDKWEQAKAFAAAHAGYCEVFDSGQFKTVFTSEYRLAAVNLDDPRIAEGLRVSLRAIQQMQELAATRHIRFVVVLIPTKEAVFRELWRNPSPMFRRISEHEDRSRKLVKAFLDHHHIEYLDALPALRDRFNRGIQPYQVSHDGHPNEQGHKAIAEFVAASLTTPKQPTRSILQVAGRDMNRLHH